MSKKSRRRARVRFWKLSQKFCRRMMKKPISWKINATVDGWPSPARVAPFAEEMMLARRAFWRDLPIPVPQQGFFHKETS